VWPRRGPACDHAVVRYRWLEPAVLGWVGRLVHKLPDFTQIDAITLVNIDMCTTKYRYNESDTCWLSEELNELSVPQLKASLSISMAFVGSTYLRLLATIRANSRRSSNRNCRLRACCQQWMTMWLIQLCYTGCIIITKLLLLLLMSSYSLSNMDYQKSKNP